MESKKKSKPIKAPNLLVLIILLIFLASLLTYFIPAGTFSLNETGTVDAGTFHFIEANPVNPLRAFSMIFDGMNASSYVIFTVLLMGGSISAILSYGSIEHIINYALGKLNGKNSLVPVVGCMILMSFLASIGGSDAFVAFVPVGVIVSKKLRLDPISAVAMFFMASFVGFFSGPFCMTAQTMAGVPVLSGFSVRSAVLVFMTVLCCAYTVRYCRKIQKDPSKSLMGNTDWLTELESDAASPQETQLDLRAVTVLFLLILSFAAIAILIPLIGMDYSAVIGILMALAIISGLIYGVPPSSIADKFLAGCMQMSAVAVVIGFAKTIGLVLEAGNALHTIIYYLSLPLSRLGAQWASVFLFFSNAVINLFIPSNSGQAAVVLPLMLPIGEILGIPTQVIVSAFLYGDGLTNLCIPTFSALMGSLMIAKVPFGKWLRFVFPFIIISFICLSALLMLLTWIGWTGL